MPYYPSKEFILQHPVKHRPSVVALVQTWKTANRHHDYNQIKQLLHQLARVYHKPVTIRRDQQNPSAYYDLKNKTIVLTNNSIITALHEFAHHLYGASERMACRWSIWLFIQTFPQEFAKLTWEGHVLKHPKDSTHALTPPSLLRCQLQRIPTTEPNHPRVDHTRALFGFI